MILLFILLTLEESRQKRSFLHAIFFTSTAKSTQSVILEEKGFEPMVQKKLYFDLANQCFKPLSHSSLYTTLFL